MPDIFIILDIIGISAFSISGFLAAKKRGFDIFGIFTISFITALFGGFIRDISINKQPFIFTENYPLIVVTIIFVILTIFRDKLDNIERFKIFWLADSIGLVAFSITGALIAVEANLNYTSFIILSLLPAVGGGIVRDVLLHKKITVFQEDVYATIAIFISTIYFINPSINSYFIFIIFLFVRLYIIKKRFSLPKYQ